MKFLLDTNTCIYIINNRPESVRNYFLQLKPGDVAISSITLYELLYGAFKSSNTEKNREAVRKFIEPMEVLSFGQKSAELCGRIRATLEKKGEIIGGLDMQIAAIALSNNLVLVTNNIKEFKKVENLPLDNWFDS